MMMEPRQPGAPVKSIGRAREAMCKSTEWVVCAKFRSRAGCEHWSGCGR